MNEKSSTILIADDDARITMMLERALAGQGHKVLTASNGEEVLKTVNEVVPDLFLLDVMMPKMDGLDTCRQLKRDPKTDKIPIIFITARDETQDILIGFEAGASDYIRKPINKAEMLARIGAHLKLYHSLLELERLNRLAFDANPSTGLPGNNSIAEAVAKTLENGSALSVIYSDLDNFKSLNDYYGFALGDKVIKFTAEVLKDATASVCGPGGFIGHIGGDDFILLVPSAEAREVAVEIIRRFDAGITNFYEPGDIKAGGIVARDRKGQEQKFPVISISLAGVDLKRRPFNHYLEVADVCAELKHAAKQIEGSIVLFDRRGK